MIERTPFPVLALWLLFGMITIALHLAIFFQGSFPLFGRILLGRPAVNLISFCILVSGILMYGIARLKLWAWWGSWVYLSLLTLSSLLSFSRYSFYDLIQLMDLPAYELAILDKMMLIRGFSLAGLIAPALLSALGLLWYSKRYFCRGIKPGDILLANSV